MKVNNNYFNIGGQHIINTKLKQMCRARGLTALQLGQAVGMPEMHIYYIERGRAKPSAEDAQALARFLNMPVAELFPGGVRP